MDPSCGCWLYICMKALLCTLSLLFTDSHIIIAAKRVVRVWQRYFLVAPILILKKAPFKKICTLCCVSSISHEVDLVPVVFCVCRW